MRKVKTYNIYEGENIVYTGSYKEISSWLDIRDIYGYLAKDCLVHRKYRVVESGEYKTIGVEKEIKPKTRITKHQKTLNYLIQHLRLYGNVYLNDKPNKYLKELSELGYECDVRELSGYVTETLGAVKIIKDSENEYILTLKG